MFRFVIFLGALFVSETIGAALNSSGSEYVLGKDGPTPLSENNAPLVNINADVELVFRTELVQNITAKLRDFSSQYSKLYAGLPGDDVDVQANFVVSKLHSEMEDIFKWENESVAEYYKERVVENCVSFLDEVYDLIYTYDELARDPIEIDQLNATYYRDKGIAIYQDTKQQLNHLKSSASTCKNDKCIKIKNQLQNLNTDAKLREIFAAFQIYVNGIYTAIDKIRFDSSPYRNRYEDEVIKSFTNFKNCVELEKKREALNISRVSTLEAEEKF